VGTAAAPEDLTEEELEAYGRALLMQTMEDLKGDYSIGYIMHSGGNYVFDYAIKSYELHLGDQIFRVIPNRRAYQKLPDSPNTDRYQVFKPKDIAADSPISVTQPAQNQIDVTYDGIRYRYVDGNLNRIYTGEKMYFYGEDEKYYNTSTLIKDRVNLSLFSIEGMREATAFELWWWDIAPNAMESPMGSVMFIVEMTYYIMEIVFFPIAVIWDVVQSGFNRLVNLLVMLVMALIPPLWPFLIVILFG